MQSTVISERGISPLQHSKCNVELEQIIQKLVSRLCDSCERPEIRMLALISKYINYLYCREYNGA
jgi:hypothetical protein